MRPMTYTCFDIEQKEGVAHVRFNRPDQLNTMTRAFWGELPQALRELDATGKTRVAVISSTGKHFSAGMDLSVFQGAGMEGPATQEVGRQREELRRMVLELQDSFSAIEQVRMPVIAAVQGGCIGGAVDMICACDMRYCTAEAFFCIQEINLGMVADVGTLQRLPKLVPPGMARELAYTGRRLPAGRAREVGLVNEVYEDQAAMLAAVEQIAREIAEHSPLAVHGSKEMLNYARDHSVADSLDHIATWQSGMFQAADMLECFAAKGEKRKPVFEDLVPIKPFSR
jgi:enoyl-CoA hydratase